MLPFERTASNCVPLLLSPLLPMLSLPRTVPTPVVVLTRLSAEIVSGPFKLGSELVAVPVYVAFVVAYVPSEPVHVLVRALPAVVAVNVALTALTDFESNPCATASPAPARAATAIVIQTTLRMLIPNG